MILSGLEIEKKFRDGAIIIDPFSKKRLNPNSYNLRLADELVVYKGETLDMKTKNEVERVKLTDEGYLLKPGRLYLGRTVERTETKGFVPMLEGRSSVGRLGILVHVTAGFGDVGFKGYWTLELACVQPVKIYPNVEICQIYYHTIQGEYFEYSLGGKYQNNEGVQESLLWRDFERG